MEIIRFILSLFSQFIEFLDNFYIIESLSFLRLFIIIVIFSIAIKFLVKR